MRDIDFVMKASLNLFRRSRFKEQLQRFFQIVAGFVHGLALTRDIDLRAQSDISVALFFKDCSELSGYKCFFFMQL
jgi:hypothetical protein